MNSKNLETKNVNINKEDNLLQVPKLKSNLKNSNKLSYLYNDKINNMNTVEKTIRHELIILKLLLCLLGIATLVFLNNFPCFFQNYVVCFNDYFHNSVFRNLNIFLFNNPGVKNFMLISGSAAVDITILYTGYNYSMKGESWRLLLSVGFFYGVRMIIQKLYIMKIPIHQVFSYPGFPSLFVSYLVTNDYFYSGHVGFPIICGYELRRIGKSYYYICIFISIFEGIVMLSTYGHYSIDCYFGWIISFYFIRITTWISSYLDKLVYIGNLDEYPSELDSLNKTPKQSVELNRRTNIELEYSNENQNEDNTLLNENEIKKIDSKLKKLNLQLITNN